MSSEPTSSSSNEGRASVARRWIDPVPDVGLVLELPGNSFAAEQYRNLAIQLEDHVEGTPSPVLLVTSADPGSGKTLTTLNLAITLGRRGKRKVLVVEGDLWKPTFANYLERDESDPGLSDVIADSVPLGQALRSLRNTTVDVLFAGQNARAHDLFTTQIVSALLDRIRRDYDLVVVDSPPVVLAGGRTLAACSSAVAVVVRARKSAKRRIEEALAILGPEKVAGLVLNDASLRALRYGSYGYGSYGYGSYGAYTAYESYAKRKPKPRGEPKRSKPERKRRKKRPAEESSDERAEGPPQKPPEKPVEEPKGDEARQSDHRLVIGAAGAALFILVLAAGFWIGKASQPSDVDSSDTADLAEAAGTPTGGTQVQAPTTETAGSESPEAVFEDDSALTGSEVTAEVDPVTIEEVQPFEPEGDLASESLPVPVPLSVSPAKKPGDELDSDLTGGPTGVLPSSSGPVSFRTTTRLNMRATPSEEGLVRSLLPPNIELQVDATRGDWYRVTTSRGDGWVHRSGVVSSRDLTARPSGTDFDLIQVENIADEFGENAAGGIPEATPAGTALPLKPPQDTQPGDELGPNQEPAPTAATLNEAGPSQDATTEASTAELPPDQEVASPGDGAEVSSQELFSAEGVTGAAGKLSPGAEDAPASIETPVLNEASPASAEPVPTDGSALPEETRPADGSATAGAEDAPASDPIVLVVTPPKLLSVEQAEYPRVARRLNRTATIVVAVVVDETGRVAEARLETQTPPSLGFGESALEAARTAVFEPATRDGSPMRSTSRLTFTFARRN